MKGQIRYQGLKILQADFREQFALFEEVFHLLTAFDQQIGVVRIQADIDDQLVLYRVVFENIERIGNYGIALRQKSDDIRFNLQTGEADSRQTGDDNQGDDQSAPVKSS